MNIAIVGAGAGGTNLMRSLSRLEDINISVVVEKNPQAEGLLLAESLNIPSVNNLEDISSYFVDTVIEATGNAQVESTLNEMYCNKYTLINSKAAKLLMTLVEKDVMTVEKLNEQLDCITNTTGVVQKQLESISLSVETIQNVSDILIESTKNSTNYIKESDQIISNVNKIAKQTKILGINATIEAARAGEYGKGFSVVANEVQNLANSSSDFANEINRTLSHLSLEIQKIHNEVIRLDSLSNSQVNASEKVNEAVNELINQTVI